MMNYKLLILMIPKIWCYTTSFSQDHWDDYKHVQVRLSRLFTDHHHCLLQKTCTDIKMCVECLGFNEPWPYFSDPHAAYKCWVSCSQFNIMMDYDDVLEEKTPCVITPGTGARGTMVIIILSRFKINIHLQESRLESSLHCPGIRFYLYVGSSEKDEIRVHEEACSVINHY